VEGLVGLTIFLCLIVYYMNPIAQRLVEGIRLQLANAQLAQQLRDALALVKQDAATDPLTGQPNRRALDLVLTQQLEVSGDPGRPLSVLLLDIDHFKRINDTHGHGIGDDVLRAFTRRVRGLLRENDLCARLGGEEFVVVLPDSTLQTALEMAERLRSGVAETPLLTAPCVPVTVSIGAAQYSRGQSATELLEAADQAVYAAKRRGRNQVHPQTGFSASGQQHSGPQTAVPGA
jgi:diguanylate cyclase (GGDEF)-like protein